MNYKFIELHIFVNYLNLAEDLAIWPAMEQRRQHAKRRD